MLAQDSITRETVNTRVGKTQRGYKSKIVKSGLKIKRGEKTRKRKNSRSTHEALMKHSRISCTIVSGRSVYLRAGASIVTVSPTNPARHSALSVGPFAGAMAAITPAAAKGVEERR